MKSSNELEPVKSGNGKADYPNLQTNDTLGMPPRSIESEQVVLGRILLNGEVWEDIRNKVKPEIFYDTKHQEIAKAFHLMWDGGIPIDLVSLLNFFRIEGDGYQAGGSSYWSYLMEIASNIIVENLEHHLNQINKAYSRRLLWEKSHRLIQAVEKDDTQLVERLKEEIFELQDEDIGTDLITLANRKVIVRKWLLEMLFPDGFPAIIYGAGGIGKSYLALYIAVLSCLGGQRFMGYQFQEEPLNVLIMDWELDADEQALRGKQIALGLNLLDIPNNLHYFAPIENLLRVLPKLKRLIKAKDIKFLIIDSIGASGTDGENVQDVVNMLTGLKRLGIATLVIDHQSKMQAGEKYVNKTPFGSVYKENLARSVFQLSRVDAKDNRMTLRLRHAKTNFSKLADDIVFDMCFEGDRILFAQSTDKTPETEELERIWEVIKQFEEDGDKAIQKTITEKLKGEISRDRVVALLEIGEGKYWDINPGKGKEKIYITKTLKPEGIYNQGFRVLDSDSDVFEIPEVLK